MSLYITEQETQLVIDLVKKLDLFTFSIMGNKLFRKINQDVDEHTADYALSKACRNKWSTTPSIIDTFVRMDSGLSQEEKDLVLSWKKCLPGEFAYIKDTEDYSIFFSKAHYSFYAVKGLQEPISKLVDVGDFFYACLLPYKDCIIWDATILFTQFAFTDDGLAFHAELADEATKDGSLITQLGASPVETNGHMKYLLKKYHTQGLLQAK